MKRVACNTLYVLLVSALVLAQAPATDLSKSKPPARPPTFTTCQQAIQFPEDGTSGGFTDSIPNGATNYYIQDFLPGHSYSVDVWDPFDPNHNHFPFQIRVFDSTCSTAVSYQDTSNIAPFLKYNANRASWIQTSIGPQVIELKNFDNIFLSYTIRITDTTLYNPRWSTFSGFITQYAFVNVTNSDIVGTLTVYDNTSTFSNPFVLATSVITVPAGGEYFYTVTPPTVQANHFGFSTFAFVGPPGAVRADADIINSTATVIVPATFGPISEPH